MSWAHTSGGGPGYPVAQCQVARYVPDGTLVEMSPSERIVTERPELVATIIVATANQASEGSQDSLAEEPLLGAADTDTE